MTGSESGSIESAAMSLLEEALDLPSDEQEDFIRSREAIAEEVRDLALEFLHSDRERRLAIHTGGAGEALRDEDGEIEPPELPGYRIVRQLGRGGMGAVFLAERSTRDFEQSVAIKVIKPGVLGDTLVERFRRERQILARLNHPNIAHLHDGGETADGQPYIVMEYIKGRTLRDWLSEEKPDLDRKLNMFLQAAQAVEFAHQNLVIHRDLTPNNVLVTDSEQAKLIDFGIARPQQPNGEYAAPSRLSGLSLTPGFAAPERASGDISTTLTDIFSLGRILSMLILNVEDAELKAIAERAGAEDAAERFSSVSELIEEIENYRANLPVVSFSNTSGYRVKKFIAREKVLVGGVLGVLLAVLVGLGATAIAYNRAEDARQLAQQRFDGLRDLANFQLFDLYDEMDSIVGNTQARLALAQRSQQYLLSLAESRSEDIGLQLETAEGFLRLARIQGIPAHPNFGEPELAAENLQRAQAIYQPLAAQGNARANSGIALLESYRSLIKTHDESDPEAALQALAAAEAALDRVPAGQRDWGWMHARRISRVAALEHADLALDSAMIERYAGLLEQDISEWPEQYRQGYEQGFDVALARNYQAIIFHNLGTDEGYNEAIVLYHEADALFADLGQKFPNDPLSLYRRAWNAYYGYAAAATVENMAQADSFLEQARTSVQELIEIEEADNALNTFEERLLEAQADYFANTARADEAIVMMRDVMAGRMAKMEANPLPRNLRDVAYGSAIYGTIFRRAGRREEACENWRLADRLMTQLAQSGSLNGFIADLHPGVQANIALCDAGVPVTEFQPLS